MLKASFKLEFQVLSRGRLLNTVSKAYSSSFGEARGPPAYMLGDGPLFESDIESMEVGDCEASNQKVMVHQSVGL